MAELVFVITTRNVVYINNDVYTVAEGQVDVLCPDGVVRSDSDANNWDFETSGISNVIREYLSTVCGLDDDAIDSIDPDGDIGGIVTGRNHEYHFTVDTVKLTSTVKIYDSPGQALLRKFMESLPDGPAKEDARTIINR